MVEDTSRKCRFGAFYFWLVFDECLDDGHMCLIKGGFVESKWFDPLKIGWRRLTNPQQFGSAEDLCAMAGIILEPVQHLSVRARRFADEEIFRRGFLRAKLNNPPLAPLSKRRPPPPTDSPASSMKRPVTHIVRVHL